MLAPMAVKFGVEKWTIGSTCHHAEWKTSELSSEQLKYWRFRNAVGIHRAAYVWYPHMDISMDISMDLSMDIHIHGNPGNLAWRSGPSVQRVTTRSEKPQNCPLSNSNTGAFAMLSVIKNSPTTLYKTSCMLTRRNNRLAHSVIEIPILGYFWGIYDS